MSKVHRGRWVVRLPEDRRDLIYVAAKDETRTGGGSAFSFSGTRREMQALRTALAAALTMEKP